MPYSRHSNETLMIFPNALHWNWNRIQRLNQIVNGIPAKSKTSCDCHWDTFHSIGFYLIKLWYIYINLAVGIFPHLVFVTGFLFESFWNVCYYSSIFWNIVILIPLHCIASDFGVGIRSRIYEILYFWCVWRMPKLCISNILLSLSWRRR